MRDRNTPCGRRNVFFETFFIHASYAFLAIQLHIILWITSRLHGFAREEEWEGGGGREGREGGGGGREGGREGGWEAREGRRGGRVEREGGRDGGEGRREVGEEGREGGREGGRGGEGGREREGGRGRGEGGRGPSFQWDYWCVRVWWDRWETRSIDPHELVPTTCLHSRYQNNRPQLLAVSRQRVIVASY